MIHANRPGDFTREQCERLVRGMTDEQVAAILGGPPADYTNGRGVYLSFIDEFPLAALRREYPKSWTGDHGAIGAVFDDGKLRRADWYPNLDPPPDYWKELRRWFSRTILSAAK